MAISTTDDPTDDSPPDVHIFLARWVCPIDQPPIEGGGVAVAGDRILAVGTSAEIRRRFPRAALVQPSEADCDSALLPGLVNAHVHLELSSMSTAPARAAICPAGFVDWLLSVMGRSRVDEAHLADFVNAAVDVGVAECLRFGVTTVGDISRQCGLTRARLRESPIRVVSFGEVQAMATRRKFLAERIATAIEASTTSPGFSRLRIGITPHAPYSIEAEGYRQCLAVARRLQLPLATHLAECADEAEFLADHTGPFRRLWDTLGWWDDAVPKFTGGPIRFAQSIGLLDYPSVLAHVNYCDDDELAILAAGKAGVVYCPRTHAYFGHPPHRWREMLSAGVNVAVGTDSRASSPDLNLVDDLRLLRRLSPETPAGALWRLATINAARALGMADEIGSISPGKQADFVSFAVSGNDPLAEILDGGAEPNGVWIAGRKVG
jgi:cytosine/adenosine deaminase-related metal-dependent hydrolase